MVFESLLNENVVPVDVYHEIISYVRPNKIDEKMKYDIEIYGTFNILKGLRKLCYDEWDKYCIFWNNKDKNDIDYKPIDMHNCIESYITNDKNLAEHMIIQIEKMQENENFLNNIIKKLKYKQLSWKYDYETKKYKRITTRCSEFEIYADLASDLSCIMSILDKIEYQEHEENDYELG